MQERLEEFFQNGHLQILISRPINGRTTMTLFKKTAGKWPRQFLVYINV